MQGAHEDVGGQACMCNPTCQNQCRCAGMALQGLDQRPRPRHVALLSTESLKRLLS